MSALGFPSEDLFVYPADHKEWSIAVLTHWSMYDMLSPNQEKEIDALEFNDL